ncbi:uncharacterized protein Dana_GF20787 [Drosophila ananassae]|uniref:UDP-glucuronosyltransferase n=1 Tax=Drosophila ananassae TaxID=7217 RepID=B3MUB4_DROAN|nr:UDP-glucuronosyltransferase 1A1 [Drosophila ananassae]EDV33443.2 uncharacterized protein Dana_GF20787 [Drosophila ananassae]
MKQPPVSWALVWLFFSVFYPNSVKSHHILGLFVNMHRSQLLVHLAVCQALLQKGHQLTLVTTLPLENHEIEKNVTHILITWKQPKDEDPQGSQSDFFGRLQRMFQRLEKSEELLHLPEWKSFLNRFSSRKFDLLLLGYHFNDHLLGVATHFDCPVAIITTQQPTGFVNNLMGNPEERWYVSQPYDSHQRSGLGAWVFGVWEKIFEELARRVLQKIYSSHFPEPHYPSFQTMRKSVALALNNHHAISEGPIAPVLPNMVDIGGIVLEQRISKETVAIGSRPIILFSLGTRFTWKNTPEHILDTFERAFAEFSEYDIYWTYDGPNAENITMKYPFLRVSKWWPQCQLLGSGNVRLFITHGGKGSLSEALYYGVPMLGLPLLGDQRANLQKMQARKWGLTLSTHNLTQFALSKAMSTILTNSDYKEAIATASQLYRDRPQKSSDLATYWIEYIIRHNGAHNLQNPARHLSFNEYYSLDIYLLVYGGLVLIIFIVRKLNRLL